MNALCSLPADWQRELARKSGEPTLQYELRRAALLETLTRRTAQLPAGQLQGAVFALPSAPGYPVYYVAQEEPLQLAHVLNIADGPVPSETALDLAAVQGLVARTQHAVRSFQPRTSG